MLSLFKNTLAMSTLDTLHQAVDNMPEAVRMDVLEYIAMRHNEYLPSVTDAEKQYRDELLKQLLLKRYDHYKAHPETALTAAEAKRRTYERYGW